MKPGVPWSVKGIEPEAREAAKQAARRSGMTLGEWLNNTIATGAEGVSIPSVRPAPTNDSIERAASRLETIAEQLATIARREGSAGAYTYPQEQRTAETEHFARIVARVEANERSQVEGLAAINDRLAMLGRQVSQANRSAHEFRPEEHPSYQALEKAVRNIVEHLEVSEKRSKDSLKSLQERMNEMATRANTAQQESVQRQAPAISQLENRLGELAQRIEQAQSRPHEVDLRGMLQQELSGLTQRIDTVRDAAEGLAAKAQTQAVQASQKELRIIEERILGLLKEAQNAFAGGTVTPAEMLRLRTDIENLNKRIDASQRPSTVDAEVKALKSAVDQMSSQISQGPDMRPLVELHKRVNDIARRIEQVQQAPVVVPQVTELEMRIQELDQRLNAAMHSKPVVSQNEVLLEQKIAEVAERMDRTEHQLTHLGTIEKAITQLFDGLEQNRQVAKQTAEEAAHAAITQFAGQFNAPQLDKAPEIIALQQGLHAIQDASRQAEGRNQETLVALHETLEHIVGKLGELETAAIGQRMAAAVEQDLSHAAATAQVHSQLAAAPEAVPPPVNAFVQEQVVVATPEVYAPAEAPAVHAPQPELSPVQMAAEAAGQNPFQTSAAPFAVDSQPASTPSPIDPASGGDFIAAARRSAQAALTSKSSGGSVLGGVTRKALGDGAKSVSIFERFKRKPAKAKAAATATATADPVKQVAVDTPQGLRKALILSGVVILCGVGYFMMSAMSSQNLTLFPKMEVPAEGSTNATPAEAVQPVAPPLPAMKPDKQGALSPKDEPATAAVTEADEILTGSLPSNTATVADVVGGNKQQAVAPPDESVGPETLRTAAAEGNPRAQFVVATRYLNGERVDRDFAQAAYWYGRAAAAGLAPAQYRVATLYERGKGVERDMGAALGWYERAAALGNVRAMHNAAVIAASKDAGGPDYAKAFKWFSLASAYGLKDSQFNLAVLLERGLGTKAQPEEALFWYHIAARQNDADAAARADALARSLDAETAARAKRKADGWVADKSNDTANVVADDSNWQTASN